MEKVPKLFWNQSQILLRKKEDFIRMQKSSGFWELEEDENYNVKVIYQFHPEPEGKVPAWLANSFIVSHPLQVLKNLKDRLKKY